ncbi:MAG: hypothetical protein ACJ74W_01305, partial [Pyrinomonadaceae bacterium]
TTLRTTDAQGSELSSSVVTSPEGAQAQAQVDRAQFPDATAQTVMPTEEAAARRGAESAPSTKSGLRQFGEGMLDVAAAPRSIMTSADLSAAGRQGLIFTVTHPLLAGRAMARQVKSLVSQNSHDDLMRWLVTHPDADMAERAGLYSAMKEHASLSGREEAFMSRLAGKLPVVKQSERAYVAYLDSLRQDVFSKYARQLERAGLNEFDNPEEFKSIARFVNSATGRGELPAALQKVTPVLNATMFAPRNLKGRIDVLNPVYYAKLAPAARKIAIQQMTQFAGTVVAGMTLARLGGAKVTIDPRDPDFGKVVVGHTHYDLTGGHRAVVRYVLQMSKAFAGLAQGQSAKRNQDVLALTTRFLRQNAAPVPAYLADAATGKTITGQDFKAKRDALRLMTPLVVQDLYEGWRDSGGRGLLKATPAVVGIGVQTYQPKVQR